MLSANYGTMELTIEKKGQRLALLIGALAVAVFLSYQSVRLWLADHQIHSGRLESIKRGAAMEPGNAEAWDILGRFQQLDFVTSDPLEAIQDFQNALHDNPLSAYYWMNLAGAYELTGDVPQAREAFEHAKAVYPLSAEVAWNYGSFLLRQEQFSEGYAEIKHAVHEDPNLLTLAISRVWRSSPDVNTLMEQVLPADAEAYFHALDFFASIQQADAGLAVWKQLMTLGKPIEIARSFPFLYVLIREDRSNDASRVWSEAVVAAGIPHERTANESLVWNGNFSHGITNGGLGWRWNDMIGVAIDFDSPPPLGGGRSLRLDFGGGNNLEFSQPLQYVPVEPNCNYHFHAYLRTEAITTESGMRFLISDPNHSGAVNILTEPLTGSHPWTAADAEVMTGPQTHFLSIALDHRASRLFDNKLGGAAWIGDISLVPSSVGTSR